MKVVKLKYASKAIGIADLLAKGLLIETEIDGVKSITEGIHNLGYYATDSLVDVQGTIENGVEVVPTTYLEGYHVDMEIEIPTVLDENGADITPSISSLYDFTGVEIFPNNSKHKFA